MGTETTRYNAIRLRHSNMEPENLIWVGEQHDLSEGKFDGPVLFPSVERAREVWGQEVADPDGPDGLGENGTHEIVEVVVTVQKIWVNPPSRADTAE